MSHVVPSQVVKFMDNYLSQFVYFTFHESHGPFLESVVRLTNEIPHELITISGEDYTKYILAITRINYYLRVWAQQGPTPNLVKNKGEDEIPKTIRELLMKCPDEAPTSGTATLPFISDADLRESIRNDISAANQALHDGLWKGSTVLAGAAVEALLLWAIQRQPTNRIETARANVLGPNASTNPERWGLDEYIRVAKHLRLIKDETQKQTVLARDFRNLIHPGRSARKGQCDRGTALSALAAVELVVRDLS
jgi:hypothetical protein